MTRRLRTLGRFGTRSRSVALGLLVGLCLVTAPTGTPRALAVTDDTSPDVALVVSAFDGVLGPGTVPQLDPADPEAQSAPPPPVDLVVRVLVENTGLDDLDQLRLVVEQFSAVEDRPALHQALDGEPEGVVLRIHEVAIRAGGPVAPADIAGAYLRVGPDQLAWAPGGGVHPVRISVVRGTRVVAEVVTAAVWLDEPPASPLRTVLVWPLETAPARGIGGVYTEAGDRALMPGGRLDGLVSVLERGTTAPVVPAIAPHLLEELVDRSDGYTRLERVDLGVDEPFVVPSEDPRAQRAAALLDRIRAVTTRGTFAPLSMTYADAELAGLLTDDAPRELRELAGLAMSDSIRRLQLLLGTGPDASAHLLGGPAPARALDLVPGSRVVIRPHAITGTTTELAVRPIVTPAGRSLDALVGDAAMSSALSTPDLTHGDVVAAQRVIADSALAHLSTTGTPERTLTIVPDRDWAPTPAVAHRVLTSMRSATWLELTDPATASTRGRRTAVPLVIDEGTSPFDRSFSDRVVRAERNLTAIAGALPGGTAPVGHPRVSELRDTLLRSTSGWLHASGRGAADALVAEVERVVDETLGTVTIAEAQVTLTSDTGSIPITLERATGGPLDVRVEVASQGRLAWPDGRFSAPLTLDPGARQTVTFTTRALSTGRFPVTVRVTDPDGRVELARTTMSVRSTTVSTTALWSTGILVAVLLVAGIRRRSGPRLQVIATRTTTDPDR
ncbi:MAG: DUF6049 family protein [Nitriliruptoraceae bacterium]